MNWIFKVVPIFIGLVVVAMICWSIFVGTVAVKTYNAVEQDGLRSVIDRIWEGNKK